jgi:hypothetical protein
MEQEISLLKQEISRLECLNRLLLDRIITLEQLISPSVHGVGGKESSLSPSIYLQGGKEHYLSLSNNLQGDKEHYLSPCNEMQGDKGEYLSPFRNMQGNNSGVLYPLAQGDGDKSSSGHASINKDVDPNVLLVKRIRQSLAQGDMKGARHKVIDHAADALLYVSRGGQLDYHYAMRTYGYGDAGATKFIISLQRRGLLERKAGRRQLFLTDKARKHLPE